MKYGEVAEKISSFFSAKMDSFEREAAVIGNTNSVAVGTIEGWLDDLGNDPWQINFNDLPEELRELPYAASIFGDCEHFFRTIRETVLDDVVAKLRIIVECR